MEFILFIGHQRPPIFCTSLSCIAGLETIFIVIDFDCNAYLNRKKELEMMILMKEKEGLVEGGDRRNINLSLYGISKFLKDNRVEVEFQQSM